MLLVVMAPATALGTAAAQQGGNFMVSVAGTAVGSIPHQIDLKITQFPGGQISEVTGFAVGPEDVVQVKQGENLVVFTSPDLRTHQVTVRNIQGIPIDLVPLPSDVWSLQGLLPGVYTLDVTVAMSSSGILGIYETMLVVLAPNQQPLSPTTLIEITIEDSLDCPGNSTLVNGSCVSPPTPPLPPCDENTPPGEPCYRVCLAGEDCPPLPPLPNATGPIQPGTNATNATGPIQPGGGGGGVNQTIIPGPPKECPEGQTGIPPNCQPINCDVEDPPPECGEQPVVCPDGSTVSPGNECPEQPGLPPVNGGDGPPPEFGPPSEGGGGGENGNGGDGTDGGDGGDGSDGGGNGGGTVDIPSMFG